jgi:hypothetical protein
VIALIKRDFYLLANSNAWLHTRVLKTVSGRQYDLVRVDFSPHVARQEVAVLPVMWRTPEEGWQIADERWDAAWHVPADGTYTLSAASPGSEIELLLDGAVQTGEIAFNQDGTHARVTYVLPVRAGDHRLEVHYRLKAGLLAGGRLTAVGPEGAEVALDLSPYAP